MSDRSRGRVSAITVADPGAGPWEGYHEFEDQQQQRQRNIQKLRDPAPTSAVSVSTPKDSGTLPQPVADEDLILKLIRIQQPKSVPESQISPQR